MNFGELPARVEVAGSVLLFGTGPEVSLDGALTLPPHAGALTGPG